MYMPSTKQDAIALRHTGKSYTQISNELGIPKSTLSDWFKGQDFSKSIKSANISANTLKQAENIRSFNLARHAAYRQKLEREKIQHAQEVLAPEGESLFFLFMGIFWGEGGKKERFRLGISNTDPSLVLACMDFLKRKFSLTNDQFRGDVRVHINLNPSEAMLYWSKVTKIPLYRLRSQVVVSSASKGKKPINTLPYGTFNLIVSNAALNRKVQGWLHGLRNLYMPN